MKKDIFLRESITLIISNLATGVFGFIFSIILSKKLGPEGMGLYGLVMPVYDLFICLISGGMITAISKVSAVYCGKNDYTNLNASIKAALSFDLVWALIVVSLVFANAPLISTYLIKDARTLHAVQIMCPAMLFIALSSILKGFFYGTYKVRIPAAIDIFEKALRIIIFLAITSIIAATAISDTVTAAYTTLTFGELISLVILYTSYKINRDKTPHSFYKSPKTEDSIQLLFDILVISFPLCLNGFLSTAIGAASTLIIPKRLVSAGFDYSTALSLIGKFVNMSLTIPFFPIIVVSSICTVLIPDLSQNMNKKNYWVVENRISKVMIIAFGLGITVLAICLTIPDSLGEMFYGRNDIGSFIKFISLSSPFTYVSVTTYAILNGLNKQNIILRNSLIVSLEELVLLYIFIGIPAINIYGYGITLLITSLTAMIINIYEIKKECFISFSASEALTYVLLGMLIFFILSIIDSLIPDSINNTKNVIIIASGFATYFLIYILFKKNGEKVI